MSHIPNTIPATYHTSDEPGGGWFELHPERALPGLDEPGLSAQHYREQYESHCSVCGAEPMEPCRVVCGGPDEDPRLDGRKPGRVRLVPHFYR